MSTNTIQTSFAAGELSPTLNARVDLAKYHIGAAKMRNFFVDYRGGASTRPGTQFAALSFSSYFLNDPMDDVRLIRFQFSTIQTYMLEFGNFYMRVFLNGAPILEPSVAVTGITQAGTGVVTAPGHGYALNDTVFLQSIGGMTELNQRTAVIANVTANTFTLRDIITGANISTSTFTAYTSGGTVSRVFTLVTPYAAADLDLIKFTQSADVLTLVHTSYAPYDLTRTSHYQWTLTAISFASNISAPTGAAAITSSAGVAVYAYVVTAVGSDGQESIASSRAELNTAVNIAATAGFNTISWNTVIGAVFYNVYKAPYLPVAGTIPTGVAFGFIGNCTGLSFTDNNIVPDYSITPPLATNPFAASNNPGAVGYFQQRKTYGGSTSLPETMWLSQTAAFKNFDVSNPVKGDDAITITLASRQVNNIKYMVDMPGGLVVLTGGSAWQINGGSPQAAVTPTSIVAQAQTYNGIADVEPLPINADILYVQAKGTVVRDFAYNFYQNIYVGSDISVLSSHLLFGFSIAEWAYAEEPFKIIWTIRDDGHLLSLTFLKEQEVYGWAQHDTYGSFISVSSIQENNLDSVYLAVRRQIGANPYLVYIERMAGRTFPYGAEDAWCLDCALQNTLTYPATGLQASAISGIVTFTADDPIFVAGDIGKVLRMDGGIATITANPSLNTLTGTVTQAMTDIIPNSDLVLDGEPIPAPAVSGDWSLTSPITEVAGLDHLEGQSVVAFGDGNVFPVQTVSGGAITLSQACTKVTVGLPFQAQLQTLDLDTGEPTIQGKRKKIAALSARVADTRGLKIGPTFGTVVEYKQRRYEPQGQPISLQTGDQRIIMSPSWNVEGRMCIQVDDPVPATVLGVIPEVVIGDSK